MGILSSRKIEQACIHNIIVKSLAADNEPDHDTIATFISKNHEAVKDLFTQVLLQYAEMGVITGEMYSVDGCRHIWRNCRLPHLKNGLGLALN